MTVTRRSALGLAVAGSVGLLAGCVDTSGAAENSSTASSEDLFTDLPDTTIQSGDIDFRQFDSGDQKSVYFRQFFDAYHKKHSNVKFTYKTGNWPKIQETITLALRNGTAPDVFNLPGSITLDEAVQHGWVGAFDDVIPNWKQVKAGFSPDVFIDGSTDLNGKTYFFPISSAKRMNCFTMYSTKYTEQAGYDLSKVLSWDDFRTMAKKVTKQGNGEYYGLIISVGQAQRLNRFVATMAEMAGVHGGSGINWLTGEYNYTNPIMIEAMELFLAMKRDGSIVPGVASMNAAEAYSRFPQGAAGVLFDGAWVMGGWLANNPQFSFGINLMPQLNTSDVWPETYSAGGSNHYVYAANTKYPKIVGDIFSYLVSEPGQRAFASIDGAADPAFSNKAIAEANLSKQDRKAFEVYDKYMALAPTPSVRNPDVLIFDQVRKSIQPGFSDVCTGLFTGQLSDVKKAFKDLQDRSDKNFEEALAAARQHGAKVSRDDWVFSDWNPKKDYTKLYKG